MNLSLLFEVLSQLFHQHVFRLIYNHVFLLCFFHSVFLEVLLSEMTAFQPRLTFVSHLLPFAPLPFHLPKHASPFFIQPPSSSVSPAWLLSAKKLWLWQQKDLRAEPGRRQPWTFSFMHQLTRQTSQNKPCAPLVKTHTHLLTLTLLYKTDTRQFFNVCAIF